jgi:hypothetical protein
MKHLGLDGSVTLNRRIGNRNEQCEPVIVTMISVCFLSLDIDTVDIEALRLKRGNRWHGDRAYANDTERRTNKNVVAMLVHYRCATRNPILIHEPNLGFPV